MRVVIMTSEWPTKRCDAHNHQANGNSFCYATVNDTPGRVGAPIKYPSASVRDYFLMWLLFNDDPFRPFRAHVRSWCSVSFILRWLVRRTGSPHPMTAHDPIWTLMLKSGRP
jgi:hypothetical protein